MARVAIISTAPPGSADIHREPARVLRRCAGDDRFGVHQLVEDPGAADVIVFADRAGAGYFQQRLWLHPLVRRYPERCFTFCSNDRPFPFLPGLYPGLPAPLHDPARTAGSHYLPALYRPGIRALAAAPRRPPRWLWSFVGDFGSYPLRARIGDLAGAPGALVRDTSAARQPGPSAYYGYDAENIPPYLESLRDSAFVLCPRGRAPTSLRLFEAMQLGRVPVIVADRWLAPAGPDWETFSLRVPEAELPTVPARVAALREQADAMGARARAAWDAWFAEEVTFHRVVETCLALRRARRLPERLARWRALRHLADPELRAGLGHRLRGLIG